MGFQALFKFVKCWRAPDVVRETVPSSWGGDGERALAEFQTSAREIARTGNFETNIPLSYTLPVYFFYKECSTEVITERINLKAYTGRPHQCLHLLITWKF